MDVVRRMPGEFSIKAISGGNVSLLSEQAKEFNPDIVVLRDENDVSLLKKDAPKDTDILSGSENLEKVAAEVPADIVFMAISGTAALKPLIAALKKGRVVALASKEPVVSAGEIIKRLQEKHSATIIPVDSEHSAIMQCLEGRTIKDVRTLYVTGTGGSLWGRKKEEFDSLTVEEILDHPKWNMGRKITVDSATLMNKGLEVIEARWLFGIVPEKIKVVIHPQAIIHSMVEFNDGTIAASLFQPDMRFPIIRALAYPDVVETDLPRVNFSNIGEFSFSDPDLEKFPAYKLACDVLEKGGTYLAVLNASNEAAVELFLDGKIKFTDIVNSVKMVIDKHEGIDQPTLDDIISAEEWAKETVLSSIRDRKK